MYNRREFLKVVGAGAAGALVGQTLLIPGLARADAQSTRKPNILIIMPDDMGYHDHSLHGNTLIPTPNLDALAADGVRFLNGYASGAVCCPTRAGFNTGRYQSRFGMNSNSPASYVLRDSQQRLIPSYLRPAGYATGLFGKWHQGMGNHPMDNYGPTGQTAPGYDEFFGYLEAWHNWNSWPDGRGIWVNRSHCFSRDAIEAQLGYGLGADRDYWTDALNNAAMDFIQRHKDEPFYLWLAHGAPHTPIETTQKWLDRVPTNIPNLQRTYAAMIISLDDGVGRILRLLRDLNLEQDTIVFFLSDNGGTSATLGTDNFPWEGTKASAYEGGYHVPFAVSWKGHIDPGLKRTPVISLDILATAVAVAEATPLASQPLDGVNLLPWLTGEQSDLSHRYLFWNHSGSEARDWSKYKWRLGSVYNLETDPEEKTPLPISYVDPDTGETRSAIRTRLQNAYNAWAASL